MPISVLFCEGGPNSPDLRVLSKLLTGLCLIRNSGGKYGMGERIKAWREVREKGNNRDICCGILDGDFIAEWKIPANEPRRWESEDKKINFGWRWERKEIENYLIDPGGIEKSLGVKSGQANLFPHFSLYFLPMRIVALLIEIKKVKLFGVGV